MLQCVSIAEWNAGLLFRMVIRRETLPEVVSLAGKTFRQQVPVTTSNAIDKRWLQYYIVPPAPPQVFFTDLHLI